MAKPLPSLSTRTQEFTPRELPLSAASEAPRPAPRPYRPPAGRIKDAIIRWLEEEL
jgi:hypothetical protein